MGNRLLLADDSITIQKVVGIIFANEDYELTVVDNGDAALEKARETGPDLMLVDALMPGKTGYEVCAAVRRDPRLKNTPILLMTGAFEPFDEEKARESGADDFISKPFESQQLIDKVKSLMVLGATRAAEAPAEVLAAAGPEEPFAFGAEELAAAEAAESFTFGGEEAAIEIEEPGAATAPPEPFGGRAEAFFAGIEEVSPADDLWGAFELEDEVVEETVEFGELVAEGEGTTGTIEAVSSPFEPTVEFSFDMETPAVEGTTDLGLPVEEEYLFTGEPEPLAAPQEAEQFGAASAAEPFSFGEVAEESVAPYAFGIEEAAEETVVPFGAPLAAEEPAPLLSEQQFAPEEEYVPAPEAVAAAAGTITLTEEQLAAAISRISKEIIERIAWEVVPDLAEALIREEIRRIREGK